MLSFQIFNSSFHEKFILGWKGLTVICLFFLANLRIKFCREEKGPSVEEYVRLFLMPFANHKYPEKYSDVKRTIVVEPEGGREDSTIKWTGVLV